MGHAVAEPSSKWPTPHLEHLCDRLRAAIARMRCLLNSAGASPENPLYGPGMVTIYQLVQDRRALLGFLHQSCDDTGVGERLRDKAQRALQMSHAMRTTYPA